MANVPNGVETLRKILIAWVGCTNVTDRQTDGRTTLTFLRKKVHPVTWLIEDFLTSKWPGSFTALAFAHDDLPHDLSDLEMTWLPWRPGAATAVVSWFYSRLATFIATSKHFCSFKLNNVCILLIYVGNMLLSYPLKYPLCSWCTYYACVTNAYCRLSFQQFATSANLDPLHCGVALPLLRFQYRLHLRIYG